ncbi:MAG: ribosome biogenesis GTP-binding protein YihA/YsxC [Gammaproteobacteria bacterium]
MSGFSYKDLPEDKGIEIAICGRSNSGKSSILNSLSSNKKLAKTSKTPGRTQSINIFTLNPDKNHRIADLPGYGFAKVSKKTQKEWGKLIGLYLEKRESLKGIVIIMDIRHPFTELDLNLIYLCQEYDIPTILLLNKSDKISKSQKISQIRESIHFMEQKGIKGEMLAASAKSGDGIEDLNTILENWFLTRAPSILG